MSNIYIEDYNKIRISGYNIVFPERIRQYENFIKIDKVAVMVGAKKGDSEYGNDLKGGNIFIANYEGIIWQSKEFIVNIWKINENTLGMYDGQTDIWVDVNKMEVVRMIWNPWGMDNPEKMK